MTHIMEKLYLWYAFFLLFEYERDFFSSSTAYVPLRIAKWWTVFPSENNSFLRFLVYCFPFLLYLNLLIPISSFILLKSRSTREADVVCGFLFTLSRLQHCIYDWLVPFKKNTAIFCSKWIKKQDSARREIKQSCDIVSHNRLLRCAERCV
jgi:hypothetical protein